MAVRLNVGTLTLIAGELVKSATLFATLFANNAAVHLPPSIPARTLVKS